MKSRAQRASEASKRAWRARYKRAEARGQPLTTRRQPVSVEDEVAEIIKQREAAQHGRDGEPQGRMVRR
jgi:hypothetical protein